MTIQLGSAIALTVLLAGGGDGGGGTDGDATAGMDGGSDLAANQDLTSSSVCGSKGPYGTYTVSGGQSGVTACGHTFTSFTGATLTITQADAGSALLTVTGTGSIGDTTNCP